MASRKPVFKTKRKRTSNRNTRRKKNRGKKIFVGLVILFVLVTPILLYSSVSQFIDQLFHSEEVVAEIKVEPLLYPYDIGTVRVDRYKDLNETHLEHAKAIGITGFATEKNLLEGVDNLVKNGKLIKIEDNNYYILKELTHSHPYLTPNAAKLLDDIGQRFGKKLEEKKLDKCCFQVSSLLRTSENQKKLSRSNSNASSNSSHLYGTSFDIAYNKVIKKPTLHDTIEVVDGPAIKLLSQTIGELRKEGRCVVVTERREACFHITVAK